MLLETTNGTPVTLNVADAQYYSIFEIEFVTEFGLVRIEDGGLSWSTRKVVDSKDFPGYRKLGVTVKRAGKYREAMTQAVENIYQILTQDSHTESGGISALETNKLCDEIIKFVEYKKQPEEYWND